MTPEDVSIGLSTFWPTVTADGSGADLRLGLRVPSWKVSLCLGRERYFRVPRRFFRALLTFSFQDSLTHYFSRKQSETSAMILVVFTGRTEKTEERR